MTVVIFAAYAGMI